MGSIPMSPIFLLLTKTNSDAILSCMIDQMRCPGCGRPEIHKMCPAYGTPMYMCWALDGKVFTKEDEEKYKTQNSQQEEK